MITLAWLILWLPFLSAVSVFLFLRWRTTLAGAFSTAVMFLALACSIAILVRASQTGLDHFHLESSISWIKVGAVQIEFGILLNGLSLLMLLIVTGVGSLIFLYSMSYMEGEEGYSRYFACLSLFSFSMLGIVVANNLIQVFIFWELVGLSSYLLIGFYFEKPSAALAGKKAFLTTRVGDVGMMIGILLLFSVMHTFNFGELKTVVGAYHDTPLLLAAALLIFMGVAGKSAQVPLHVWLPDAMEGPTPVSALMHAATMVAAGVFLLARLFFLFEGSSQALTVIAWIGILTAVIPATIALVQNDIKKVLAYSTLSQLGYMVMAAGMSHPEASMFHLMTHAFFKALLFLGAGSLIHAMHTQDIWELSREKDLLKKMPVTAWTFLIGTVALMGIPPFSGFYSKEEILAAASHGSPVLFILALIVVFLTAFYMGRVCTIVFFRKSDAHHEGHAHESDFKITLPLIILACFSAVAGFIPLKSLLGESSSHHLEGPAMLKWISIGMALSGFVSAYFIFRSREPQFAGPPANVLERKYFFDDLYDAFIKYVQESIAKFCNDFEQIAVVKFAVNGTALSVRLAGMVLNLFQSGVIQFYSLMFAAGITAIIFLLLLLG